ncbi:MAG: hypothetical protein ACPGQL_08670 [Thermoplasmatota archaeon]
MRLSLMACLLTSALLLPGLALGQSGNAPDLAVDNNVLYLHSDDGVTGWMNTLVADGAGVAMCYTAGTDSPLGVLCPTVLAGLDWTIELTPGLSDSILLDTAGTINFVLYYGGNCCTVGLATLEVTLLSGETVIAEGSADHTAIPIPVNDVTGDEAGTYSKSTISVAPLVDRIDPDANLTLKIGGTSDLCTNCVLATGGDPHRGSSRVELPILNVVPFESGDGGSDPGTGDADDTDGDGLPDQWEQDNFGNLDQNGTGDPDDDGCDNACELANGTDPNDADTDAGGVNDGDEIANGTDPNDPTDDVVGGVDPDDTDGDGLADTWEIEHFGDLSQDGTGDPDSDGCDNECEETAGTDPNDADTDKDGVSDGDEIRDGTDPLDPDDPGSGDDGADAGAGGDDTGSGGSDSDDETVLEKLEASSGYVLASLALMLIVLVLAIIGLAGRWSS